MGLPILDRLLREELVMEVHVPEMAMAVLKHDRLLREKPQVLGAILLELTQCLGRRPRQVRMEGWLRPAARRPTCRRPCRKRRPLWPARHCS